MRPAFPVLISLLLRKENDVLLTRRYNTGWEDSNYSVITDHLEPNTTVFAAAAQKAKEDLNIDVKEKDLSVVLVMQRKKDSAEYIDVFLECKKWKGDLEILNPEKHDDAMWVSLDMLPLNTVDYIAKAIEQYKKGVGFTLFGWD